MLQFDRFYLYIYAERRVSSVLFIYGIYKDDGDSRPCVLRNFVYNNMQIAADAIDDTRRLY